MGTLTFVGLGLYDVRDISILGRETVLRADSIFAEFYTSNLQGSSQEDIRAFFGKEITVLSREDFENETAIMNAVREGDTVVLTAGDPMTATTHQSLRMTAIRNDIPVRIIHSSSVFTAVPGLLGLPVYKFGRTTTLVRPEKNYFPTSPYDVIRENLENGLHTLILLDIKQDEDYFMKASEGLGLLLELERREGKGIITSDMDVGVVGRAGSPDPLIWVGSVGDGVDQDFGHPLHSMVIPGKCHFMEEEIMDLFRN